MHLLVKNNDQELFIYHLRDTVTFSLKCRGTMESLEGIPVLLVAPKSQKDITRHVLAKLQGCAVAGG